MFWKKKKKKKEDDQKRCPRCGETHDQLYALAFSEPHNYANLSEEEKQNIAEISSDFCTIAYPEQTDRFIRAYLQLQVMDACEDLDYGVWVSVSEKTFNEYKTYFEKNIEEENYFGRISNEIQDYEESTLEIHVNIETRGEGSRPELLPHQVDHQLIKDWEEGITLREAEKRINRLFKDTE